ncbi:MAG: radical SAM family heme chaperone HemW [Woeseiaceae bacterium]
MSAALPPLSLYLHLPWCVRKCPYCDFNSHTAGPATDKRRYLAALLSDIALEAGRAGGRTVETVFLGGGTPSLFSAADIGRLIDAIAGCCRLAADAEITMEANPGTLEHDSLVDYRRAGINRLSLGAQSFNDESLKRLGRIHGANEILDAWRDAERAAFDSINLDLMFALPGQNVDMAVADVLQAVRLSPAHISYYQLTLEPNTVFHAKPPADLPDDELCWDIEQHGHARLAAGGYERYEVSAFARPGFRCRHNVNYWQFGDYLALGAGAHGKITADDRTIRRYTKPAHPRVYMEQIESGRPGISEQKLESGEIGFEYLLNALRLPEGFAEAQFVSRTGLPFSAVWPGVSRARASGLLESAATGQWRPTEQGLRFLNDLQAVFLD